jgi:arylsulfatase A-like enzyme
MEVKRFLCISFCCCLVLGGCSDAGDVSEIAAEKADTRPNIILLMADDMGWGDTSFRGHPHLQTPNLDRMAVNGLVFDRFYSAAPVCSPTRASVLTGRHPFRSGIYFAMVPGAESALPRDEATLGQLMKAAGYRTGFFGKWHLGTLTTEIIDGRFGGAEHQSLYSPPWEHGFDVVFATESRVPTWDPMLRPPIQPGASPERHPIQQEAENWVRGWWEPLDDPEECVFWGTHYWTGPGEIAERDFSGDDSDILIDEAIDFILAGEGSEQPFFSVVWFHTPHLPLVGGPQDLARYSDHDFHERTYYAAVSAMDRAIGRLRTALAERGLAENTVLWFTSDNGPEGLQNIVPGSTGDLRGRKRSLYEGGIRVPGIVEWPAGIDAGSRTTVPAVTTDIFPTVLGWSEVDHPRETLLDGRDLSEFISGSAQVRKAPIGFESQYQLAWTDDRYKLVYVPTQDFGKLRNKRTGQNPGLTFEFELYDIVNDPAETTNLAMNHPEIVARMSEQLGAWRKSVALSIEGDEPGALDALRSPN